MQQPTPHLFTPHSDALTKSSRRPRALLWVALVGLLLVAQSLLVWLTIGFEGRRMQAQLDAQAAAMVVDLRAALTSNQQNLQALLADGVAIPAWRHQATDLLRKHREFLRIDRTDTGFIRQERVDSPFAPSAFALMTPTMVGQSYAMSCDASAREGSTMVSRSYFVPLPDGQGQEVLDFCWPIQTLGHTTGFMVVTMSLPRLLERVVLPEVARHHEVSLIESDGTRLARSGVIRGVKSFRSERLVDIYGLRLGLRLDSGQGQPDFVPNLTTALVLGLSVLLGAVVVLLVRDVRKRAQAEAALAEALAFRKAMENSLVTGLRATDLQGRVTYVNPAFCDMVGFSAQELIGQAIPAYWPPELVQGYMQRQELRQSLDEASPAGFESVFMRRNGERFAVMIFQAPLIDRAGRKKGSMSAILDISAQRKIEETSRQQHERLQATARLATIGEMASLLSHELNQPLSAIASYAAGSLNLMQETSSPDMLVLVRQALERMVEQATRAGKVIKSVHDFVRRRQQSYEVVGCDELIESVLPLVRLQARQHAVQVDVVLPSPVPHVLCDRTMVEQVLLNLTRNGIQAMSSQPASAVLRIEVDAVRGSRVQWRVLDQGGGISDEVKARLFQPFFTTRAEGMGLGLSLCRTVIEQHGGVLDFENVRGPQGQVIGAMFTFSLAQSKTAYD